MFEKIFSPLALIVFIFMLYALSFLDNGTSIVWTLVIPIVPIFLIIVGYNRWRQICPLAFFSKLTQYNYLFKKNKINPWFEENFYLFQLGFLFTAFVLRIYFLNSSSLFLTIFFVSVILLALLSGLLFTGKTWCNFICPVSLVERIYSSSSSHKAEITSACSTCSACKKSCPDIDMESSYWKEGENAKKKIAFYTFPGLVLGFYFYYYLQSGSWEYYYSGEWTLNNLNIYSYLHSSGFYFYKAIPLFIAVPLTLFVFSILSYILFLALENLLHVSRLSRYKDRKSIVHIVNVLVAFSAFNIFYIFAGAPTYSEYPFFYALFHFAIIVFSSTLLYKEIFREEKYFLQEKFARKILQKWDESTPPPHNLKEIYYTYVNQQKDHYKHLEIYKETIEELVCNGILSSENEALITKIQKQFNISEAEHEKIITAFNFTCKDISQNIGVLSSEKLYQLQHYKTTLADVIADNPTNIEQRIQDKQIEFDINDEEHAYIYNELVNKEGIILSQINTLLDDIIESTGLCNAYHLEKSLSLKYLFYILDENRLAYMKELKELLSQIYSQEESKKIIQLLYAHDSSQKTLLIEILHLKNREIKDKFSTLFEINQNREVRLDKSGLENSLSNLLHSKSDKIVACALYAISQEYEQRLENFEIQKFLIHTSESIHSIANKMLNKSEKLTLIEKEAYLHKVPLFSKIHSENLTNLASEMLEVNFEKGDVLVNESDEGDSLFVITHGEALVSIDEDSQEKEIAKIYAGDYIGEISILSKLPRTATVSASTSLTSLELSGESFKMFIIEHPYVSLKLMQEITKRLLELKS